MEQVLLIVCAVAILVYILWRVDQHREHKEKLLFVEYDKKRLSDEAVIKAQAEFEKRLEENVDLPDGITWRAAFIYWQLMRAWFASLLASSGYTGASDKIKSDWLDYMDLMERRASVNFLYAEAGTEEKRDAQRTGVLASARDRPRPGGRARRLRQHPRLPSWCWRRSMRAGCSRSR